MKRSPRLFVQVCVIAGLSLTSTPARAWDPLGHGLAAATGARIMEDSKLRKLLLEHERLLQVAAAFPDIPFRKLSTEIAGFEAEASNHFFHLDDPKVIPLLPKLLGASCSEATRLLGHEATRTGVSPWRAEQFEKLALSDLKAGRPVDAVYHAGLGTHEIADHAVPWHALSDAHGVAAGHPGIHIFLEGCTDRLIEGDGEHLKPAILTGLEEAARKRRNELLVFLERDAGRTPALAIRELQESRPKAADFETLDNAEVFVSRELPKPGTPKDSPAAARFPASCWRFDKLLKERLATAAAFVSIYLDHLQKVYKGGGDIPPARAEEVKEYEGKPYPWFQCGN